MIWTVSKWRFSSGEASDGQRETRVSANYLYVIQVWVRRRLIYDAIRATKQDAIAYREILKSGSQHWQDVRIIRFKRERGK